MSKGKPLKGQSFYVDTGKPYREGYFELLKLVRELVDAIKPRIICKNPKGYYSELIKKAEAALGGK